MLPMFNDNIRQAHEWLKIVILILQCRRRRRPCHRRCRFGQTQRNEFACMNTISHKQSRCSIRNAFSIFTAHSFVFSVFLSMHTESGFFHSSTQSTQFNASRLSIQIFFLCVHCVNVIQCNACDGTRSFGIACIDRMWLSLNRSRFRIHCLHLPMKFECVCISCTASSTSSRIAYDAESDFSWNDDKMFSFR